MFIRRRNGTFFAVLMPKRIAEIFPWRLIHIIPEIIVSTEKILVSPCFSSDLSLDPFYLATRLILDNKPNESIKVLNKYYSQRNKKAFNLSKIYFCSKLKNLNEMNMYSCMPWQDLSKKDFSKRLKSVLNSEDMKRKAIEYKLDQNKIGKNQVQGVGVLSKESIKVEFERYKYVSLSIRDNGYKLNNNFINGFILKDDEDEKIIIFDGLHKTFSLLALGYKNIRVCLSINPCSISLNNLNKISIIKNKIATKKGVKKLLKSILSGQGIF